MIVESMITQVLTRKMGNRGVQVRSTSETDPLAAIKGLLAGTLPQAEPHVHDHHDGHHH